MRRGVVEDLGAVGVLLARHVPGLLEQRQVHERCGVALGAGIAVPIPGAAEVAALLDDSDVVDAGVAELRSGHEPGEAATDERERHLVEQRLTIDGFDVGVLDVVLEDAGDLDVLLVAVGAQPLLALLAVLAPQRLTVDLGARVVARRCLVPHGCTVQVRTKPALLVVSDTTSNSSLAGHRGHLPVEPWETSSMQVALALYPGVSADECEAFTCVFDLLDGAQLVGVGARVGAVEGPGGGHRIDATFADVQDPDVVLVPGGIGCARAARDEPLLDWLRTVASRSTWMAASSTGTVIVAAAGLLNDRDAATHWLAGDLLAEHGSQPSEERVVEVGNVITCEGRITAMHVALLVTLRVVRARGGGARAGTPRHRGCSAPRGSEVASLVGATPQQWSQQRPGAAAESGTRRPRRDRVPTADHARSASATLIGSRRRGVTRGV